jgi:hypothetical protein
MACAFIWSRDCNASCAAGQDAGYFADCEDLCRVAHPPSWNLRMPNCTMISQEFAADWPRRGIGAVDWFKELDRVDQGSAAGGGSGTVTVRSAGFG